MKLDFLFDSLQQDDTEYDEIQPVLAAILKLTKLLDMSTSDIRRLKGRFPEAEEFELQALAKLMVVHRIHKLLLTIDLSECRSYQIQPHIDSGKLHSGLLRCIDLLIEVEQYEHCASIRDYITALSLGQQ